MHKIHTRWLMEASSILHRSILSKRTPWILIRRMTSYIEVCFTKVDQNNIKWHYMHTRCNGDAKSRLPHWLVALLWFFWKIFFVQSNDISSGTIFEISIFYQSGLGGLENLGATSTLFMKSEKWGRHSPHTWSKKSGGDIHHIYEVEKMGGDIHL